jgi:hypothetical protein
VVVAAVAARPKSLAEMPIRICPIGFLDELRVRVSMQARRTQIAEDFFLTP